MGGSTTGGSTTPPEPKVMSITTGTSGWASRPAHGVATASASASFSPHMASIRSQSPSKVTIDVTGRGPSPPGQPSVGAGRLKAITDETLAPAEWPTITMVDGSPP